MVILKIQISWNMEYAIRLQTHYIHTFIQASVIAVAVSAYLVSSLDVCPPVQEDLDGPEVAVSSSPVECGESILLTHMHGIKIV